ncbi:hypothetical protein phiOC_p060 [Ochrobactrum phage vB_OspM_OC]|nr:hypothetical protein phiOC_p060 [Ochrobactrum phage vB_OspM_OC]
MSILDVTGTKRLDNQMKLSQASELLSAHGYLVTITDGVMFVDDWSGPVDQIPKLPIKNDKVSRSDVEEFLKCEPVDVAEKIPCF